MVVAPEIADGCAGIVLIATASVCEGPVPQALLGVTVIVPGVASAVATMLLLVELPDHPPGNDHT